MKTTKALIAIGLVTLMAIVVVACGGDDDGEDTTAAVSKGESCEPEGELNAILWEGYAPKKSIEGFEKKYGVKVNVTSIASNDEVFAKIRNKSGQYDLIPATTDVTQQYVESDLVEPLDLSQVPNAEKVFGPFKDLEEASRDDEVYGVAHTWSADPIIYNADVVKDPEASYDVLFDDQYAGDVALYDDLGSLWVGALVLGHDPFNLSEEEMDEVVDRMTEQKDLVRKYWSSGDDLVKLMASGEVNLATGWSYMYTQLKDEGVNVKRLVPEEGNLGWVDTLMIPVNAEHPCAAYKWMDWALSPEGGSATANASGYSIANPEVADQLTPEQVEDLHMNDPEFIEEIVLWERVARPTYQDAWNQVKSG
jgi:spermidine/putrescine-binding protein